MLTYTYLVGDILLALLAWVPLYACMTHVRRPMLVMSLLAAPLGLVTLYFFTLDYWVPQYVLGPWVPLEEVLFAFLIGGIGGASYEAFFPTQGQRLPFSRRRTWAASFFVVGMVGMLSAYLIGINSIYASTTLLGLFACSIILVRRDLRVPALFSAVVCALLMLVVYTLLSYLFPNLGELWMHDHISGYTLFGGVPIEEFVWAAAWGLFAAPAFELVAGSRYIR